MRLQASSSVCSIVRRTAPLVDELALERRAEVEHAAILVREPRLADDRGQLRDLPAAGHEREELVGDGPVVRPRASLTDSRVISRLSDGRMSMGGSTPRRCRSRERTICPSVM